MNGGVIMIGSLFWDNQEEGRKRWWEHLDFSQKIRVALPIRYGRSSSKNRKHTYSMVFSNELEKSKRMGYGYVIPFIKETNTKEDFQAEVIALAKAEGFEGNRIGANWGVTCLKINPRIKPSSVSIIMDYWNNLITNKINQNLLNIEDFGGEAEDKSVTDNYMFNISDSIFKQISGLDYVLATSNALKHRKTEEIKYPNFKEIARAMYEGNYYEYFLRNRMHRITTYEDRLISKILKKKYRIVLKDERKKWT